MPVLIGVLKSDRMDVEIIKLALETLNILCSKDKNSVDIALDSSENNYSGKDSVNVASTAQDDLGGMLAEIFVKVGHSFQDAEAFLIFKLQIGSCKHCTALRYFV